jgi:hypothetical protein
VNIVNIVNGTSQHEKLDALEAAGWDTLAASWDTYAKKYSLYAETSDILLGKTDLTRK